MFIVTEAASSRLAERLSKKEVEEDVVLRLARHAQRKGWTIGLGKASPGDKTYAHNGRVVLVCDEGASHSLRNKMLDVRETDEGPRLRLR